MSQQFVRYSPDVEKSDPNFAKSLEVVLAETKRRLYAPKTQGSALGYRSSPLRG